MAIINIVKKSQIESTSRIDADYYQPEYVFASQLLQRQNIIRLAQVADISDGNHLKVAEKFLTEPGVRYLRGQDITSDMLIEDRHEIFVPDSVFNLLSRSHIFRDDVLITIVGANTGLIGLVYDSPEKLTANCKLGIVRPKDIEAAYLYVFLISRYGQDQIQQSKRGGGQTGLILPDMRNLVIARFSPTFEKAIAREAEEGHAAIKKSKELYSQAEQFLFSELGLFSWKPKHNLTNIRQYSKVVQSRRLDAEYYQPKFQTMFDMVRKNARSVQLGKLATLTKGIEVGGSAYTDLGIPFWRVSNLTKRGMDTSNLNYISHDLYQSLQKDYEPQQGEVLLSKDATPGISFYLETPIGGIISSGILRLAFIESIPSYYFELVLNSTFVQLQIEQDAGGSIIKHWKPSEVRKTLIPRLQSTKEAEIATLVQKSHAARRDGKNSLEKAKRAVEIAIEQNEESAMIFLNDE